uniref:Uncharacterized protein n=1 Tax=Salix viminalis TaxID=40686 RepID=A0A6N2M5I9_SALVM
MPSRQHSKQMLRFRAVTARFISSSIAFLRLFRPINFPIYTCSLLGLRRQFFLNSQDLTPASHYVLRRRQFPGPTDPSPTLITSKQGI